MKNIQRVYSHPQALGQCARFIEEHGYRTFAVVDTSGSVAMVKEMNDPQAAAIAGDAAAEYWDMKILKPGIESDPKNFTRFYIVCRKENKPKTENPDKVSIVFSTKDEPGALLKILKIFADGGLNLSKLESRPIFGKTEKPTQRGFSKASKTTPNFLKCSAALKKCRTEIRRRSADCPPFFYFSFEIQITKCYRQKSSDQQ